MSYYRKADVFVKNPKIKPYIDNDDLLYWLKEDLDIHENDNLVLLTYKFTTDRKNACINDYKIYPEDIRTYAAQIIHGFNNALGKTNMKDYFNMMTTAEIKDYNTYYDYDDGDFNSSCTLYIVFNIGNLDMKSLRKVLPIKDNQWLRKVEFDSVFVQDKFINGQRFNKPFKNRCYLEPISNIGWLVNQINSDYHTSHKSDNGDLMNEETGEFAPIKPEHFGKWPIWRIKGLPNETIQYAPEIDKKTLCEKRNENPHDYKMTDFFRKKHQIPMTFDDILDL